MKLSQSFIKTLRNAPKDEAAKSAQYLIRAGYIHKELAGVYDYLPLGLRVMNKITEIIREELNAIGGEEVNMSALQNPLPWQKTDRWDDDKMDIWFKTKLQTGSELGLAPTHEEPLTNLMKDYLSSYKEIPVYVHQFQTKFRNELRAKSGILRTREFLMSDLYSFSPDEKSHQEFYAKAEEAYRKIFNRLGIGDYTVETFSSGGPFSKYSHEFQTFLDVGEDTIWFNKNKSVVINDELMTDEILKDFGVTRDEMQSATAAEVGNIFTLGLRFSEPLGLVYNDQEGNRKPIFMGSYGIGVSRVMGVIAEKFADDKGLVWPEAIAPYQYYLIAIGDEATKKAEELHDKYPELFLYDDRDLRPGVKFADAELMGIPQRVVISDKTLSDNKLEITARKDGTQNLLTIDDFIAKL